MGKYQRLKKQQLIFYSKLRLQQMQNYITFAIQIESSVAFKITQRLTNYPIQLHSPKKIKISLYQSKKNQKNYLKEKTKQFQMRLIQEQNIFFIQTGQKNQKGWNKQCAYVLSDNNILQSQVLQKIAGEIQKLHQTQYSVLTYKWGGYFIDLLQINSEKFLLILQNQNGSTLFNKITQEDIKIRVKHIFQDVIDKLINQKSPQFYLKMFSKFAYEQILKHQQITSKYVYYPQRKTEDGLPKNIQNLIDINFLLLKYARILEIHECKKIIQQMPEQQKFEAIQPQLQQMRI